MSGVQVRGMLLEEALLFLLRQSGYSTVTSEVGDDTLCRMGAGLAVHGRGTDHQIDAIADYAIQQPFSHPQRLLVEAKCYDPRLKVSLNVVRNALGTLRDVHEFFPGNGVEVPRAKRYHYQYAIFSATGYTEPAQRYAFAQDIYLIRVAESQYFAPVITAIRLAAQTLAQQGVRRVELNELRYLFRRMLLPEEDRVALSGAVQEGEGDDTEHFGELMRSGNELEPLREVANACKTLGFAVMVVAGRQFPILLIPSDRVRREGVKSVHEAEVYWRDDAWYLTDGGGEPLFSFTVPQALLSLYSRAGTLSLRRAIELKHKMFSELQAVIRDADGLRIVTFRLNPNWIAKVTQENRE